LAANAPRVRTALGLHPQVAHQRAHEISLFRTLVVDAPYVGEIGLDGSSDFKEHSHVQEKVFREILEACSLVGGRILSIHSRGAASKVLDILEAHPRAGTPILHWFSGSALQLRRAVKLGCWFSVGPAMLNSATGRALAANMPMDRVLTETDGPFAKIAGKTLEPANASLAVPMLASIWGLSPEEVTAQMARSLASLGHLALQDAKGTSSAR
jgi:TatD DNase family protein